jgi:hypothetical protein
MAASGPGSGAAEGVAGAGPGGAGARGAVGGPGGAPQRQQQPASAAGGGLSGLALIARHVAASTAAAFTSALVRVPSDVVKHRVQVGGHGVRCTRGAARRSAGTVT